MPRNMETVLNQYSYGVMSGSMITILQPKSLYGIHIFHMHPLCSLAIIGPYLSHRRHCSHLVLLEALGQHVVLSVQPLQDLVKSLKTI